MLLELSPRANRQFALFDTKGGASDARSAKLMGALEGINQRYGRGALRLAAEGCGLGRCGGGICRRGIRRVGTSCRWLGRGEGYFFANARCTARSICSGVKWRGGTAASRMMRTDLVVGLAGFFRETVALGSSVAWGNALSEGGFFAVMGNFSGNRALSCTRRKGWQLLFHVGQIFFVRHSAWGCWNKIIPLTQVRKLGRQGRLA